MKRLPYRYSLMLWAGIGILFATVAANRLFSSGLINYQVLYEAIVQGWQRSASEGMWQDIRILLLRLAELAAVGVICQRAERYRRQTGIYLLLFYLGATVGVSVVLMTWCRGAWGIVCYIASCMPHDLFYLGAWGIMILRVREGGNIRSGKFWGVVLLLFLAGLFSEICLNPVFSFLF